MTTEETIAAESDATEEGHDMPIDETPDTMDAASLFAALEEANAKIAEMNDSRLRALADYANLKRRSEEERDNLRQYVAEELLKKLLPIADNFERALTAAEQTHDYDKLIGGVNAVHRQLQDYLTKQGIAPIAALHQPFNPNLHDAIGQEPSADHPDNTVIDELQKGYTLNGRVIRPTMVKVSG